MSLAIPHSLEPSVCPRRAAHGTTGVPPRAATAETRHLRTERRLAPLRRLGVRAIAVALLAALACQGLRNNLGAILSLFDVGNVMSTNDESQLFASEVTAASGHVQCLLAGACVILLGVGLRRLAPRRSSSLFSWFRQAPQLVSIGTCLVCGAIAVSQRSALLDGKRYFILQDDAMTSMVFARNLVEGHGLVYQPGEVVEGFSNLMWVGIMALVHALGPPPTTAPLFVLVAAWLLIAATGALMFDLLRKLHLSTTWGAGAVVLFALDRNTWVWGVSGLETSAVTAGVMLGVWALVRDRRRVFAVALACVCALRSDGILLAGGLGAAAVWYRGGNDRFALTLVPAIAVTALIFACRWLYYGHVFPNTYYLKMLALSDRLLTGFGGYGIRMLCHYGLFLALLAFAASAGRKRVVRLLGLVVFLQAGYTLYLGGDIFRHLRFFAPVIPLLYCGTTIALHELAGSRSRQTTAVVHGLALLACPAIFPEGALGKLPDESTFFLGNLSVARLFIRNMPSETMSSIYPAGTVPYYAKHVRYVDVLGKNDAHIAHLPHYEGRAIGHNKSDFGYVYDQRKPDVAFVLLSCDIIDQYLSAPSDERKRMREQYSRYGTPVRFSDIDHPTFQREYYPNRVHFAGQPSPTPLECLFVRNGSTVPRVWATP